MDTVLTRINEKLSEQKSWNYHFNFKSSFSNQEKLINKITEKELSRLASVFVKPEEFNSALKILRAKSLLIISGEKGVGRTAASINLFDEVGSSKIFYGKINNDAQEFIEKFDFKDSSSYIFKVNFSLAFSDSLIKKIKSKLDEKKSKLIFIIHDNEYMEDLENSGETLYKNYYFQLSDVKDKLKVFNKHFDYEIKSRENPKIRGKHKLLIEDQRFVNILNDSSLKNIYYITKRLISRILRNFEFEDLLYDIESNSYRAMANNFSILGMEDKVYSIAVAVLEKQPYQFLNSKIHTLQSIMKPFYPIIKEEKKEEVDKKKEFEKKKETENKKEIEKFEYWKYNPTYIKRLYKEHLKKNAKIMESNKEKEEEEDKEENKEEKKEEKKEIKDYFEIYKRSSVLDRINVSLDFGQFENEFGLVQKEYVKFTEDNYSNMLLKHILDEYYVWRDLILEWILSIKCNEVPDYKSYYEKLAFIGSIIEEDFNYFEAVKKLIVKDDFENNFKIAYIFCSVYKKNTENEFIKKILKKWADSEDQSLRVIALISFAMISEKKSFQEVLAKYKNHLKDSKKEDHERILVYIMWIFKFIQNNSFDCGVHEAFVSFLHDIIADNSIKKYKPMFKSIIETLFKSSASFKDDTKPYFVYFSLNPDLKDKVLKIMENHIYFSNEIDKAFESIKEILKSTDKASNTYEYTEFLFIEFAKYNKGANYEALKFYLKKWKSESKTAEKILSSFDTKRINLNVC